MADYQSKHHDLSTNEKINIVLVDENKLYRESFKTLLADNEDFQMMADVSSLKSIEKLSKEEKEKIDILLIEIGDNPIHMINSMKRYQLKCPHLKTVALTYQKDEMHVLSTVKAGVQGYLSKDMDFSETIQAIQDVYHGKYYIHEDVLGYVIRDYQNHDKDQSDKREPSEKHHLSKREREVLELLLDGRTNSEIAEVLSVKEVTVKNHVYNLMKKMNVEHRTEAVLKAIKKGWVII